MSLLGRKAHDYGISLTREQLRLFRIYLNELWEWNQRINLTGLSTPERIIIELFLDSLIPAPYLPNEGEMIDIGTGSGIPGIPLKIYLPELKTSLLEPSSKKVAFLKHVLRLMSIKDVEILNDRLENLKDTYHHSRYQLITSRAFAKLDRVIPLCSPFLCDEGLIVIYSGHNAEQDIKKNRDLVENSGLKLKKIIPYLLPGKAIERKILIFRKGKNTD